MIKSKILPIGWDFILLQIMDMNIRTEVDKDFKAVFNVIKNAFENEAYSDHQEHYLVERLRKSDAFVPELSLVAEINNEIVGYILLTKIKIIDVNVNSYDSLALAPVAVLPNFQGKGIGRKLIETAHEKAKDLGFSSVVLLGHENYYPRFGYKQTKEFGIKLPFDVPEANCMAIELMENGLQNVKGTVKYPKEFGIE